MEVTVVGVREAVNKDIRVLLALYNTVHEPRKKRVHSEFFYVMAQ